ncbi:MAG: arginine--tRNA ligase [Pyrinomonadaceae bacterium]
MSLIELQKELKGKVAAIASEIVGSELGELAAEVPPKAEFGDLAFPVAFEMAKILKNQTGEKQNPREIAERLKANLLEFEYVSDVQIAGPGYLNVFFDRGRLLNEAVILPFDPFRVECGTEKYCVEHTSVNPNKAAHIGHLRNSVLGDTFARILRASGKSVEIQNYIDNTGVQVADVVVGFVHLEKRDLESIIELDKQLAVENKRFDYYCWDLYTKVGIEYQSNDELKEKRAETLHLIEEGSNEIAVLADYVATRNVECILDTMERISIRYDLLPRESEILHLHFWEKAFGLMKEKGVIEFSEDGKNKGCWVMPFGSHEGTEDHDNDKILVRSNGTVTYTGKDIAYQMWKLGLLGLDFLYRKFSKYEDGTEVWITTADADRAESPGRNYGNAARVYNVIDTRQSYPQQVVQEGVALIYPERGTEASVHLSYEMVALSQSAAEDLGFVLSDEDKKKPFVEMSGRKGLGVKADDLIDRLYENALHEVSERNPELSEQDVSRIAMEIAVGALRYFLLKFTKNTVIVFDFAEAASFEGETGTYCQNATVRLNSIFRKLGDARLKDAMDEIPVRKESLGKLLFEESSSELWTVVITSLRLEETIHQAVAQAEPAILSKYVFNLAKASNLFYQKNRIIDEKDPLKQLLLIAVAASARTALTNALAVMGIAVPERM